MTNDIKAAAEEIRKEVNRVLLDSASQFIAGPSTVSFSLATSWDDKIQAIIQRHMPPVNERLLNAISLCSHVCDNLSHERKYQHGSNKTCPVERIVQSAIAEARAALDGR